MKSKIRSQYPVLDRGPGSALGGEEGGGEGGGEGDGGDDGQRVPLFRLLSNVQGLGCEVLVVLKISSHPDMSICIF